MIQKVLVVVALVFGILAALSVTVLGLNGGQEAGIGVIRAGSGQPNLKGSSYE